MPPDLPPLVLTLPSDLCHVAQARDFVMAVCQAAGFDSESAHSLALAVHEAIRNVIRHAHRDCVETPLELRCFPCADRIEVHILDEGDPFDLTSVLPLDPGEVRLGGRGLFLMRKLTDELSCERRGERGNVLRLVKRRCHS